MILDSNTATFEQLREWLGQVIRNNPAGHALWELMTCLRGPDSPSETSSMTSKEYQKAYDARRQRKRRTVEVIRGKAFFGIVGGSARYREDINYVTLPPQSEWDHFDKHVKRAADVLGLSIRYLKGKKQRKIEAGEPEWEVLAEGKANGVPIKKKKLFNGPGNVPPIESSGISTASSSFWQSQPFAPSSANFTPDMMKKAMDKVSGSYPVPASTNTYITGWSVTKENLEEINKTLDEFPSLYYVGVSVMLDGKHYNVTGPQYATAKDYYYGPMAAKDQVKEISNDLTVDHNDIPF